MRTINRRYKRKNMQSMIIKGHFQVVTDDNARIRIGINHNGAPGYLANSPADGIIKINTSSGIEALINNTACPDQQIRMMQAMDAVYERRRVAWVKLRFIPKYTNFIQSVAAGSTPAETLTAETNEIVYVVSDSNGLNIGFTAVTDPSELLANVTGVKLKRLNRSFKVFRRSRKFPFAPKYQQAQGGGTFDGLVHAAGMWLDTTDANNNETQDHTWIITDALPMGNAVELFTCVFEVKFVYADLRSVDIPNE